MLLFFFPSIDINENLLASCIEQIKLSDVPVEIVIPKKDTLSLQKRKILLLLFEITLVLRQLICIVHRLNVCSHPAGIPSDALP